MLNKKEKKNITNRVNLPNLQSVLWESDNPIKNKSNIK
jgi:ribosomal protein L28